jgi:hypothetical protein
MCWTGIPGHADLQLEHHLLAVVGAFLMHNKHKIPCSTIRAPHLWPAGFASVLEDLGIDSNVESDKKLANYMAQKRASLFDVVKLSSFCPLLLMLIILRHMYFQNLVMKSP